MCECIITRLQDSSFTFLVLIKIIVLPLPFKRNYIEDSSVFSGFHIFIRLRSAQHLRNDVLQNVTQSCYVYAKQVGQEILIRTVARNRSRKLGTPNQTCWNQIFSFAWRHVILKEKKIKIHQTRTNSATTTTKKKHLGAWGPLKENKKQKQKKLKEYVVFLSIWSVFPSTKIRG